MAFCPACGDEAVDTFCEACLKQQKPLIESIKPIEVEKCTNCDRIKVRGRWEDLDAFDRQVQHALSYDKGAQVFEVSFPRPVLTERPKSFTLPVLVNGTVSNAIEPYEEEYEVEVPVQYTNCDRCSRATSSYFEGVLQLRRVREEAVRAIERAVSRQPDVHITNAKDVRGGIDFYFTDQKYLFALAHDIHKRFGGQLLTQSRLITYDAQRSRQVFRLTCLIRLPEFWKGDVIETEKRLLQIKRMGANLEGFDLRRRKKTSLKCPEDKEAIIHNIQEAVLSAVRPTPTILDPETFQEVPLSHPVEAEPGSTLKVIQDSKEKWWSLEEKQ